MATTATSSSRRGAAITRAGGSTRGGASLSSYAMIHGHLARAGDV